MAIRRNEAKARFWAGSTWGAIWVLIGMLVGESYDAAIIPALVSAAFVFYYLSEVSRGRE